MRRVNVDSLVGVMREADGTAIVIATRSGRQYRISLPADVALALAAKLTDPN